MNKPKDPEQAQNTNWCFVCPRDQAPSAHGLPSWAKDPEHARNKLMFSDARDLEQAPNTLLLSSAQGSWAKTGQRLMLMSAQASWANTKNRLMFFRPSDPGLAHEHSLMLSSAQVAQGPSAIAKRQNMSRERTKQTPRIDWFAFRKSQATKQTFENLTLWTGSLTNTGTD